MCSSDLADAIAFVQATAAKLGLAIDAEVMNLETDPLPTLGSGLYDVVLVFNYLHRPLMPALLDAIAPGGVLIYETFAMGNEKFGRPSNPDFLLAPGELLEAVRGRCQVIAFEDVHVQMPKPAMVQRICARRYT